MSISSFCVLAFLDCQGNEEQRVGRSRRNVITIEYNAPLSYISSQQIVVVARLPTTSNPYFCSSLCNTIKFIQERISIDCHNKQSTFKQNIRRPNRTRSSVG